MGHPLFPAYRTSDGSPSTAGTGRRVFVPALSIRSSDRVDAPPEVGNLCLGTASAARIRQVGKHTRVEQMPGDLDRLSTLVARGPAQEVEGGDRIDAVAGHEEADSSVDDDAVVERELQLVGDLAAVPGPQRRVESGFEYAAVAHEGVALGVVPLVRPVHVQIQGTDGDAAQHDRNAEHGPDAAADQGFTTLRPAAVSTEIISGDDLPVAEAVDARAPPG